ncbi:hypothetical protein DIPPA_24085 [Diplonema papillatum]|nr:hypothetical protein DIPPA_24085 [Diplonema papillatum]
MIHVPDSPPWGYFTKELISPTTRTCREIHKVQSLLLERAADCEDVEKVNEALHCIIEEQLNHGKASEADEVCWTDLPPMTFVSRASNVAHNKRAIFPHSAILERARSRPPAASVAASGRGAPSWKQTLADQQRDIEHLDESWTQYRATWVEYERILGVDPDSSGVR